MATMKQRRAHKRFMRVNRIMRKCATNVSHAPRLRASKMVYRRLFSFADKAKFDNRYAQYILDHWRYPQSFDNMYKIVTGTGPIIYETVVGL